jgi:hypothetical protein
MFVKAGDGLFFVFDDRTGEQRRESTTEKMEKEIVEVANKYGYDLSTSGRESYFRKAERSLRAVKNFKESLEEL